MELYVKSDEIINSINLSKEGIKIQANKINLVGAVTFEMLDSDTQDKVEKTDGLVKDLRNGTTTIIGGMISTNLIDVTAISSEIADIGGFEIHDNGIFSNGKYGSSDTKFSLYSQGTTDSAYLAFQSASKWVGIGLNTVGSGGKALLRLEDSVYDGMDNVGATINISGGLKNHALTCYGGFKVNGAVSMARYTPGGNGGSNDIVNNIGYRDTYIFNPQSYMNVYLPSRDTIVSKMGKMNGDRGYGSDIAVNSIIFVHIINVYFANYNIAVKPQNSNTPLKNFAGATIENFDMGRGDCSTFTYFNNAWYLFSTTATY